MRIGELSRRTGVSERSLRYYEEQGLLVARRTAGGHREYSDAAVERVERIQCLYAAGVNSSGIYELLPCMYAQERGDPAPDLLDSLARERGRISAMIDRLAASRDLLDEVIASASARSSPRSG
ncbi:MerR family transcriptional regulator [Nocardiopsis mwathae]|uniref:MerR family transcriptional regulator n=1 Tax=Nocardiopsis mwathae TaxID=1472723 RepID=UPI001607283B